MGGTGVRCTARVGRRWRRWRAVRFEDVKPLEFLVQYGERLEFLRLDHLLLEPILDFVLLFFDEILVIIVKMAGRD